MAEQSWHKRIADFGSRRATEMQGRLPGVVKAAAFAAGLAAGVVVGALADVHTRADGSGLAAVFGPLVGVEVALLAAYVTPLGNAVRPFLGPAAVGAAALGALASVAGLAQPPLDAYRYALGVAVGCTVWGIIATAAAALAGRKG